jgi:hypothetical protein
VKKGGKETSKLHPSRKIIKSCVFLLFTFKNEIACLLSDVFLCYRVDMHEYTMINGYSMG